ncbi:nicotinamide mononucleotide adenylyltransferase [Halarchaeum rubridurum]|uniref:Nicotinamide mononucleotide adenylyltransferase n=1 Tax=Halarchaeum rubridurum TaxID=489911 RepID=A0A830G4T5_9EURY|nr:hypothetical protein [Halarchaeum rubridurum]MBP1955917.1 nicotinamide mononucleotide adenylyltransferase [Halarchaeum rubridurum]GGM75356.1 hypothetical protein GCM10009017_26640 [Halarchaeum rubridurum]
MSNPESDDANTLTPEQRLAPENLDLLRACIVTIPNVQTVQACVAYENAHQNREPILRWLAQQAAELRAK